MTRYMIENIQSGQIFGVYEGATGEDAIAAMMADAGGDQEPTTAIHAKDWDAIINLMDDEICEQLHSKGFDNEADFFVAYCEAHTLKFGEVFEPAKANPVW